MGWGLRVRKMASDEHYKQIPSKRALQVDETVAVSKNKKVTMDPEVEKDALKALQVDGVIPMKQKVNPEIAIGNDAHLNVIEALNEWLEEIESLREQFRKKDFEIITLHKMVCNLKKWNPKKC